MHRYSNRLFSLVASNALLAWAGSASAATILTDDLSDSTATFTATDAVAQHEASGDYSLEITLEGLLTSYATGAGSTLRPNLSTSPYGLFDNTAPNLNFFSFNAETDPQILATDSRALTGSTALNYVGAIPIRPGSSGNVLDSTRSDEGQDEVITSAVIGQW